MCLCVHVPISATYQCSVRNRQEAKDLLENYVVFKEENAVVRSSPSNFKSGISHKYLVNLYRVVAHLGL